MKTTIFCAALCAVVSLATQAADLVGPDITVRYADLAIDSEAGATRLLKRIDAAASRVCARLDHGDLASRANAADCRRNVTAAAVHKVNHPMLLAVYNVRRGVTATVANAEK